MAHNTRDGAPRLLEACTLPLTARGCVTRVYTDIAVMDVVAGSFLVREMVEDMDAATLRTRTVGPVTIADDCTVLRAP